MWSLSLGENILHSCDDDAVEFIFQHLAIKCGYFDRAAIIGDVLQVYSGNHGRAMVFCETKRDADALTVSTVIKQETHVLHGDIPQEKRELVLQVIDWTLSPWLK